MGGGSPPPTPPSKPLSMPQEPEAGPEPSALSGGGAASRAAQKEGKEDRQPEVQDVMATVVDSVEQQQGEEKLQLREEVEGRGADESFNSEQLSFLSGMISSSVFGGGKRQQQKVSWETRVEQEKEEGGEQEAPLAERRMTDSESHSLHQGGSVGGAVETTMGDDWYKVNATRSATEDEGHEGGGEEQDGCGGDSSDDDSDDEPPALIDNDEGGAAEEPALVHANECALHRMSLRRFSCVLSRPFASHVQGQSEEKDDENETEDKEVEEEQEEEGRSTGTGQALRAWWGRVCAHVFDVPDKEALFAAIQDAETSLRASPLLPAVLEPLLAPVTDGLRYAVEHPCVSLLRLLALTLAVFVANVLLLCGIVKLVYLTSGLLSGMGSVLHSAAAGGGAGGGGGGADLSSVGRAGGEHVPPLSVPMAMEGGMGYGNLDLPLLTEEEGGPEEALPRDDFIPVWHQDILKKVERLEKVSQRHGAKLKKQQQHKKRLGTRVKKLELLFLQMVATLEEAVLSDEQLKEARDQLGERVEAQHDALLRLQEQLASAQEQLASAHVSNAPLDSSSGQRGVRTEDNVDDRNMVIDVDTEPAYPDLGAELHDDGFDGDAYLPGEENCADNDDCLSLEFDMDFDIDFAFEEGDGEGGEGDSDSWGPEWECLDSIYTISSLSETLDCFDTDTATVTERMRADVREYMMEYEAGRPQASQQPEEAEQQQQQQQQQEEEPQEERQEGEEGEEPLESRFAAAFGYVLEQLQTEAAGMTERVSSLERKVLNRLATTVDHVKRSAEGEAELVADMLAEAKKRAQQGFSNWRTA